MSDRPLFSVLMAIAWFIVGTAFLILGFIAFTPTIFILLGTLTTVPTIGPMLAPLITMLTPFVITIAIGVIILGISNFIGAIGLLSQKSWGWTIAVITSIAYLIVIIGIIFLWYLTQEDIKSAFGKY